MDVQSFFIFHCWESSFFPRQLHFCYVDGAPKENKVKLKNKIIGLQNFLIIFSLFSLPDLLGIFTCINAYGSRMPNYFPRDERMTEKKMW